MFNNKGNFMNVNRRLTGVYVNQTGETDPVNILDARNVHNHGSGNLNIGNTVKAHRSMELNRRLEMANSPKIINNGGNHVHEANAAVQDSFSPPRSLNRRMPYSLNYGGPIVNNGGNHVYHGASGGINGNKFENGPTYPQPQNGGSNSQYGLITNNGGNHVHGGNLPMGASNGGQFGRGFAGNPPRDNGYARERLVYYPGNYVHPGNPFMGANYAGHFEGRNYGNGGYAGNPPRNNGFGGSKIVNHGGNHVY